MRHMQLRIHMIYSKYESIILASLHTCVNGMNTNAQ